MARAWLTDYCDLHPELDESEVSPRERFFRTLVEVATARAGQPPWACSVRCIARVGRRVCRAFLAVSADSLANQVTWQCATCGESGRIRGFAYTPSDLRAFAPAVPGRKLWGFDEKGQALLRRLTKDLPALRAVAARAVPHDAGLLTVRVTPAELDLLYDLAELHAYRAGRRSPLAEGMLASLCTAIDGW